MHDIISALELIFLLLVAKAVHNVISAVLAFLLLLFVLLTFLILTWLWGTFFLCETATVNKQIILPLFLVCRETFTQQPLVMPCLYFSAKSP